MAGNSGGIDGYALYGLLRGVQVVDNLIIGTGQGFGVNGGQALEHHPDNRLIRIEGNRFDGEFGWPQALGHGMTAAVGLSRPGNTFTDNRWSNTTTDIPRCSR